MTNEQPTQIHQELTDSALKRWKNRKKVGPGKPIDYTDFPNLPSNVSPSFLRRRPPDAKKILFPDGEIPPLPQTP